MQRNPILAIQAAPGDLIIAKDLVRVRVSSVLEVRNRDSVIIYGRSANGEVGIAHGTGDEVIRLV